MLLQVFIQLRQLNLVEQRFAADIVHAQQFVDPTFLVTFEVGSNGFRIDQQSIGDIGNASPLAKQYHRVDAVRLTHVGCPAVGRAEFGQFLFAESVVEHARKLTLYLRRLQQISQPNSHIIPV